DFIPGPNTPVGGLEVWNFSVDSSASGDGAGLFPSVTTEGALGAVEASADIYTSLPMPPGPLPPAPFASNNTGSLDGDGLFPFGAPGYGLIEALVGFSGDNLDAVDVDTTVADISGAPVFFSLDSLFADPLGPGNTGSALTNGFVGGDVLVSLGGAIAPYAPAFVLGLDVFGTDSDDLDALAMNDVNGDLVYTPGIDALFFSVRRGSAVIGSPDSIFGAPIEEGDILVDPSFGGGASPFPGIFIAAEWLGLGTVRSGTVGFAPFGDDLNALDITRIPEPSSVILMMIGLVALTGNRRRHSPSS
ncbi:MAG: PEP-CTERM sorting domain-containing protein, partial [Rhodothermia bacterium]